MILVIGHLRFDEAEAPPVLLQHGYRFANLRELDAALLRTVAPEMVLSVLFGDGFDAVDVALRLARLGYAGPYRALSPPLPRPDLVRTEVRAAAPGLDFDLVVVSQEQDRRG